MKATQVPALTGLRFVAATMVLIGHGWSVLHFRGDNITGRFLNPLPSMGMTLFFVLSGFVMWVNYAESLRNRFWPSLWHFGVARFARLYPLYFAVGLLALIGTNWAKLPNELPDALLFVPLLQAWVPGSIPVSAVFAIPQYAHSWSISVEMFLYLCFPAIAFMMIPVRKRVLFGFALSNVVICIVGIWFYVAHIPELGAYLAPGMPLEAANMWIGYYSPLTRINEFAAGCIVGAIIARSRTGDQPGLHAFGLIACLAGLAFVAALYSTSIGLSHEALTSAQRAGSLAGFTYLVWFLARFNSRAGRILSISAIIAGGEISYSIYLLHPLVLSRFAKPEVTFSAANFGLWLLTLATAIGAILLLSYGTWSLIEVPCRRWLRGALKFTRPTSELAVAVFTELPKSDPAC
jgi:peptidoglycan/LPS O-acetylase OafA/YrhL